MCDQVDSRWRRSKRSTTALPDVYTRPQWSSQQKLRGSRRPQQQQQQQQQQQPPQGTCRRGRPGSSRDSPSRRLSFFVFFFGSSRRLQVAAEVGRKLFETCQSACQGQSSDSTGKLGVSSKLPRLKHWKQLVFVVVCAVNKTSRLSKSSASRLHESARCAPTSSQSWLSVWLRHRPVQCMAQQRAKTQGEEKPYPKPQTEKKTWCTRYTEVQTRRANKRQANHRRPVCSLGQALCRASVAFKKKTCTSS